MLSVFILEDDAMHRTHIEKIISDTILIEELQMELVCVSANPDEIIEYAKTHDKNTGVYFFDVDLNHEMSGIMVATEIRRIDESAKIVFVTTRADLSYLTFHHKIEALDYIIKDDSEEIARRIRECLLLAQSRHYKEKRGEEMFRIEETDGVRNIPVADIMFFETAEQSHRILLHTENAHLYFWGSLKDIEQTNEKFIRCHKSFVVNIKNIKHIDKKAREIECMNGERCYVSVREMSKIAKLLKNMEK